MFKLIIFDLDGVITDTAEYHYRAWKHLAQTIGIEIDRAFNEQLKGVSRMESLELILEKNNRAKDFTEQEKVTLAKEKNDYYLTLIEDITPKDTLPGIVELLKWLKSQDVNIALGSASKNGPKIIDKLKVQEWIDYIVDPSSVQFSKPAPDLFLAAAHHFNVEPEECIVVEDAVSGIQAAVSGNMYALGVGDPNVLTQADQVVTSTDLLLNEFKKLLITK